MSKTLAFEGLRFNTSFRFKNKKEEGKYWTNLLIESPLRYKNTFEKYLHEKLHVRLSFSVLFGISSVFTLALLCIAIANQNIALILGNASITLIFLLLTFICYLRFKSFALAVSVTEALNSIEFLEMLRDAMLKDNEENKSIQ